MSESSKVIINEGDFSTVVNDGTQGVAAVLLETRRGPCGHQGQLITSMPQYEKIYGKALSGNGGWAVKQLLQNGVALRICRVVHYTDPTDPNTITATRSTVDEGVGDVNPFAEVDSTQCFLLEGKYLGFNYDRVDITITNPSNGYDSQYFNLIIEHQFEPNSREEYRNLSIPSGGATVEESDYLKEVIEKSQLVKVTYYDTSSLTGTVRPPNGIWDMTGGSNGGTVVDADYVGGNQTGMNAFDQQDDFYYMASLDRFSSTITNAGANVALSRADCMYFASIPSDGLTVDQVVAERALVTSASNRYLAFFTGGVVDLDGSKYPEIADVLITRIATDKRLAVWRSSAGRTQGRIYNRLSPVNNFGKGAGSSTADLEVLAGRQINAMILKNNAMYLSGNFTAQIEDTRKSFVNVQLLFIYLSRTLGPILESYLEQPNDIPTWVRMYADALEVLDPLVNGANKGLDSYEWKGDQYEQSLDSLKVNTKSDVLAGRYKVILEIVEIVSLQVLTLELNSVQGESASIEQI